jgi:hypothetical protein
MDSAKKAKLSIRPDGTVQVQVPGDVMFNLENSTAVRRDVLGRLGHPNCTSGYQIEFILEEQEFSLKA